MDESLKSEKTTLPASVNVTDQSFSSTSSLSPPSPPPLSTKLKTPKVNPALGSPSDSTFPSIIGPQPLNPVDRAGLFSKLSFFWIWPLIKKGSRQTLEINDLFPLSHHDDGNVLVDTFYRNWARFDGRFRLWKTIFASFWPVFLAIVVLSLVEGALKLMNALFLGNLIEYFESAESSVAKGHFYAGMISLSVFFEAVVQHQLYFRSTRLGMTCVSMLVAVLYRKLRRVHSSYARSGYILNLVSNDIEAFRNGFTLFHMLFIGPLQVALTTYFLVQKIDWLPALAGLLTLLLMIPVQAMLSQWIALYRRKLVDERDRLIRLVSDTLMGIQVVKYYAWESAFHKSIMAARARLLDVFYRTSWIKCFNESCAFFSSVLVSSIAFLTVYWQGKPLIASKVFSSLALFFLVQVDITDMFPRAVEFFTRCHVSAERLQEFLLLPEVESLYDMPLPLELQKDPTLAVLVRNGHFQWSVEQDYEEPEESMADLAADPNLTVTSVGSMLLSSRVFSLKGIHLSISRGELVMMIGPVGAGKSTLLTALLGELPPLEDMLADDSPESRPLVAVRRPIAYTSQSSWLFSGTLLDNILICRDLDSARLARVLSICCLETDIALMPFGLRSLVGERGVSLSGGQKARVCLARALYDYPSTEIYLLDDVLSAVDNLVANRVLEGLTSLIEETGATMVLVTHQTQHLYRADRIISLRKGRIIFDGDYDAFVEMGGEDELSKYGLDADSEDDDEDEDDEDEDDDEEEDDDEDDDDDEDEDEDDDDDEEEDDEDEEDEFLSTSMELQPSYMSEGVLGTFTLATPSLRTEPRVTWAVSGLPGSHSLSSYPSPVTASGSGAGGTAGLSSSLRSSLVAPLRSGHHARTGSEGAVRGRSMSQQGPNSPASSAAASMLTLGLQNASGLSRTMPGGGIGSQYTDITGRRRLRSGSVGYERRSGRTSGVSRTHLRLASEFSLPPGSILRSAKLSDFKARVKDWKAMDRKNNRAQQELRRRERALKREQEKKESGDIKTVRFSEHELVYHHNDDDSNNHHVDVENAGAGRANRNKTPVRPSQLDEPTSATVPVSEAESTALSGTQASLPASLTVKTMPLTVEPVAVAPSPALHAEERSVGAISLRTYYDFFRMSASIPSLIFLVLISIIPEALFVYTNEWLTLWSSASPANQRAAVYPNVLIILTIATTLTSIIRSAYFFKVMMTGCAVLFEGMLNSVLNAPLIFFQTNPIGRILNRFAKDQGLVDEELAWTLFDAVQCSLMLIGTIAIVCWVNVWMLIAVPPLFFVFWLIRHYYLLSSREIKRAEAIARSPVYSFLGSTIEGLALLRSFPSALMAAFERRFIALQNAHIRGLFAYNAAGRWMAFWLDVASAVFFAITTHGAVIVGRKLDPADVGLALSYVMHLIGLVQWCTRQLAEVENMMTSAERIIAYSNLPSEGTLPHTKRRIPKRSAPSRIRRLLRPRKRDAMKMNMMPDGSEKDRLGSSELTGIVVSGPTTMVADDWPTEGHIQVRNLTLTYPSRRVPILQGITATFSPKEKIAIVGRTGAGKSSFLAAFLRLTEPTPAGCITIDGVNISALPLTLLRSRVSVIPQDPILFSGSIRFNLDPFDRATEAELWRALEHVTLAKLVRDMPDGLDTELSGAEGGSSAIGSAPTSTPTPSPSPPPPVPQSSSPMAPTSPNPSSDDSTSSGNGNGGEASASAIAIPTSASPSGSRARSRERGSSTTALGAGMAMERSRSRAGTMASLAPTEGTAPPSSGRTSFSTGEKQLLCLARAILRKSKVIFMDEATANIDLATSAYIQALMKQVFADANVFTIAHRLQTVIDYDRVMVLDQGKLVELDAPWRLLNDNDDDDDAAAAAAVRLEDELPELEEDDDLFRQSSRPSKSLFAKMIKEMGPETERKMKRAAYESYRQKRMSLRNKASCSSDSSSVSDLPGEDEDKGATYGRFRSLRERELDSSTTHSF